MTSINEEACPHREHEMRGPNAYGRYFELVGDKAMPRWEFCLTETQAVVQCGEHCTCWDCQPY